LRVLIWESKHRLKAGDRQQLSPATTHWTNELGPPSAQLTCSPYRAFRKTDIVAKLGVISEGKQVDSGHTRENVFANAEDSWIGHLFGAQYSLDPQNYKDEYATDTPLVTGDRSLLFVCGNGISILDAWGRRS